jgi:hypothetical protein
VSAVRAVRSSILRCTLHAALCTLGKCAQVTCRQVCAVYKYNSESG